MGEGRLFEHPAITHATGNDKSCGPGTYELDSQEEHVEDKVDGYIPKVEERRERSPQLQHALSAYVNAQRC